MTQGNSLDKDYNIPIPTEIALDGSHEAYERIGEQQASKSSGDGYTTILQVIPSLFSGGVERGVIEVSKKLKETGCNVIVISAGGPLVEELRTRNILHIEMSCHSKNPFTIWQNAKKLAKIIREYKVDIVHARSRAPAWSCYLATKATNTKFMTTFHGVYNASNILKRFYNNIMLKGEKVIAVSYFIKQHILDHYKIKEDKIVVIHRGVDYNYFSQQHLSEDKLIKFKKKYGVPADVPILLLPSRMSSWKGQLILAEALGKIKHLDFYCLMVGDLSKHPNYATKVKDRINSLKLQSKVQIFGNEYDMLGLYGITDIVLSTSIEPEAFGRTISEGQAMEKIVIATNIGGATETIIDQQTGFHVTPNDATSLARKIEDCLFLIKTGHDLTIRKAARQAVIDNFSLDNMLNKTIDLYQTIIKD